MNIIDNYRNLANAIAIQAARDYAEETRPTGKRAIIRQLRSEYMDFITDGLAPMLANALIKDENAVIRRIRSVEEE